jgi:dihydrofolate reductase
VGWKNTRIARGNIQEELSNLKKQPGKSMVVWGGASLASSLINLGLIDEYRLLVNPVLLGRGKSLFKDVSKKHQLKLVETKAFKSGVVALYYQSSKSED